jgi:sugar phosphate isomerase/epimerase
MRLGIGSYTYAWAVGVAGCPPPRPMTAEDVLARAAALGVGVVQICDNLPLDGLPEEALAGLAESAARQEGCLEVGTRGIAPDHLQTYLRLATRLGSPLLRVVIDTAAHRPSPEETVRLLREAALECERRSITLAVENHDRFSARELAQIIASVASPRVGVCLDTVNSFGALEGPEVVMETLAPFTVSLHIKDFAITRLSHQMGFLIEGRPAGQGRLDVPWLLERCAAAGSDPNAILELWTPPERDIAATIAKEACWAEQSVAYLRQLIPE